MNESLYISRRAVLRGGRAAAASTALSYARILGANDRISLGHVGIGARGRDLASVVAHLKDEANGETTAVCDLWSVNRD